MTVSSLHSQLEGKTGSKGYLSLSQSGACDGSVGLSSGCGTRPGTDSAPYTLVGQSGTAGLYDPSHILMVEISMVCMS